MSEHPCEILTIGDEYDGPTYYSRGIHSPVDFLASLIAFLVIEEGQGDVSVDTGDVEYGLMRHSPAANLMPEYKFLLWPVTHEEYVSRPQGVYPITVWKNRYYGNMDRAKVMAYHFGK